MQAVTMGETASAFAKELFQADRYSDYLYFHGLGVQMAEALAEWTHARIRAELGFAAEEPEALRDVLAQRYRGAVIPSAIPLAPTWPIQGPSWTGSRLSALASRWTTATNWIQSRAQQPWWPSTARLATSALDCESLERLLRLNEWRLLDPAVLMTPLRRASTSMAAPFLGRC